MPPNGELVTVKGVDREGGIELTDGRKLPGNYRQFDFGYAVTAHRSQGKTVDAVVISADSMKQELFYVAASRGREAIEVITSDQERLRDSVTRSGVRQSATELARKWAQEREPRPGMHQGAHRGREAAVELAHHNTGQMESHDTATTQQKSVDQEQVVGAQEQSLKQPVQAQRLENTRAHQPRTGNQQ